MFTVDGVRYVPVSPSNRTCDVIDYNYNSSASTLTITDKVVNQGVDLKVLDIQPRSFQYATSLKEINLSNQGVIGAYAFYGCTGLQSINVSNKGSVGDFAFSECNKLQTVNMTTNVTTIGNSCFLKATKLLSVTLPSTLTSLNSSVFEGCSSLPAINLPDALTDIGSYCFKGCASLKEIVIPASVNNVGDYSFQGCSSLSKLVLSEGGNTLSLRSNGSNGLFRDCPLVELYIGRNLKYNTGSDYGYSPFYRSSTLKKVTVTDLPTTIFANEFYGCTALTDVKIGDGVTEIGNYAFSGCSSIERFTFGEGLKTIGAEAFSDCTSMTTLAAEALVPPTCGNQALDDINKWGCKLYTPKNAIQAYKNASQWKEFFFYEQLYVVDCMLYLQISNTSVSVSFADSPKITFPDGQLALPYKEGSHQWAFNDFDSWYFGSSYSTEPAGINDVVAENPDASIHFDGNTVKITVQQGVSVVVCDIAGHTIATSLDSVEIDMAKYPAGVYIVRAGNKSFKFIKK